MSASGSPARLSGVFDDDIQFAADISSKMHVPKRIQVTGEGSDQYEQPPVSRMPNGTALHMQVPDRIVVLGGERHGAGGGAPRELLLERAVQPPPADPWHSPPRVLRVDEHLRPPAEPDTSPEEGTPERRGIRGGDRSLVLREQPSPPALVGNLTPSEELELLRRQLLKVNRRLMIIEIENQRRRSREILLYTAGLAYLVVKTCLWLGRL